MKSVDMARHAELSAEGLRAIGARNACDREFIHLSGAIQPHGFLLVVDPISWVVIAASANAAHLAGFDGSLIGVALSRAFGDEFADTVRALRPTGNPHDTLPTRVRLTTTQRGRDSTFAMVAHRTGLTLVVLAGLSFLGGCSAGSSASPPSGGPSVTCPTTQPELVPVSGAPTSTLPPSHDNDVGHRRLPDLHPDADTDANQVPKGHPCHPK